MAAPALLALSVRTVDISVLVGWAFALAASTFCPLFLLGIWWTRLTSRGAAAGMIAGITQVNVQVPATIPVSGTTRPIAIEVNLAGAKLYTTQ